MVDRHGRDGYGPPASREVREAVAPFLHDRKAPPHDDKLAKQIAERIRQREKTVRWK